MNNVEILKTVGKALGREQIVIAIRSYNTTTNKLEGYTIHLFSDHESGITINSNGINLSGKYNPNKGTDSSVNWVLNPKYKMPWTNINKEDKTKQDIPGKIKNLTNKLIANNPCILEKHEAIKMLIDNYDIFLDFCVSSGYMKIKQLNHTSTQIRYKEREEKKEVAATNLTRINKEQDASAESEVSIGRVESNNKKELIKNRIEGYYYVTFEPGLYFIEDCYGNKRNTCTKFLDRELSTGKLRDIEVEWTEKFFIKNILATVPKTYVIVHSKKVMVPDDGRVYIAI